LSLPSSFVREGRKRREEGNNEERREREREMERFIIILMNLFVSPGGGRSQTELE
jgi:hypothetical protein